jgi:hypothetical protein
MGIMTVKVYNKGYLQFPGDLADIGPVHTVFGQDAADFMLLEKSVQEIANGLRVIASNAYPSVVQGRRQQSLHSAIQWPLRVVCSNGSSVIYVLWKVVVQDNLFAGQTLDMRIDKRFADQRQVSLDDAQSQSNSP